MSDLTFVTHDKPIEVDSYHEYFRFVTVYWHGHEFLEIVRYREEQDDDEDDDEDDDTEKPKSEEIIYEPNRWYVYPLNESFKWHVDTCFTLEAAQKACFDAEIKVDQLRKDLNRMFRSPRAGETAIHKRLTP